MSTLKKTRTIDFEYNDWDFEISSGYNGYRNKKTNEWVYQEDFNKVKDRHDAYVKDYELLRLFRGECLPFGEYGEIVLQEFLNKRYDK